MELYFKIQTKQQYLIVKNKEDYFHLKMLEFLQNPTLKFKQSGKENKTLTLNEEIVTLKTATHESFISSICKSE